jgi:hypothetical protein
MPRERSHRDCFEAQFARDGATVGGCSLQAIERIGHDAHLLRFPPQCGAGLLGSIDERSDRRFPPEG